MRWDDGVFYRVLCVTLLVLALTFTVILTNVFIDIDGLLYRKEEVKPVTKSTTYHQVPPTKPHIKSPIEKQESNQEIIYGYDRNYDETDYGAFRTKRSLESQNFEFHIKNPKIKNILTKRLATMLEELDAEENVYKNEKQDDINLQKAMDNLKGSVNYNSNINDFNNSNETTNIETETKVNENHKTEERELKKEDVLHLAMHNILLQGIIGHMDLNEVYRKVHMLVQNFDRKVPGEEIKKAQENKPHRKANTQNDKPKNKMAGEYEFIEELIKCDELQNQLAESRDGSGDIEITTKEPKVLIKTIIDITTLNDKRKTNSTKNNVKGLIKLIFNGKSVKFDRMDSTDKIDITKSDIVNATNEPNVKSEINSNTETDDENYTTKPKVPTYPPNILNKILSDYFKKYPKMVDTPTDSIEDKNYRKRLKRNIKIRYEDDATTPKTKPKRIYKNNKNNEELYVEIETHFDSKGIQGEKKKKLIRNLVEKIQRAIHNDIEQLQDEKKKKTLSKHSHIRKRNQDPLKRESVLINKFMLPLDTIIDKQSTPINKVVQLDDTTPSYFDKSGETWKKENLGPSFLTVSKSINSAEMGEIDLDYNKVSKDSGIPQRLQKPLNSELDENGEVANFYNLGNMKFYIKDMDGTGFSIGFNQYVGEPPDPESIKLFTGLENLIQTYHQNYDEPETTTEPNVDPQTDYDEANHEMQKRELMRTKKRHVIVRRHTKGTEDYHTNEYKIIFNNNFLPYDSYQEIFEDKNKKVMVSYEKDNQRNSIDSAEKINVKTVPQSLIDNGNIFMKNLKPSEIFSIAELFDRKKRAVNFKKITKLKKMKMSTFINTKSKLSKHIFIKPKRSKRQIDKIRIIASDNLPNLQKSPDDNIFVVSDENVFADRAVVREVELPDGPELAEKVSEDRYDLIQPYYETRPPHYDTNLFDGRSRHNALMSKYPHVFMEEISRSKEDEFTPENPFMLGKLIEKEAQSVSKLNKRNERIEYSTDVPAQNRVPVPRVQEIVHALTPKTNYKLTVKILPKNYTGLHTGFKEIHTSINKSVHKNGLLFSSLVNVSEISRVQNISDNSRSKDYPYYEPLTTMSPIMKQLKQQQEKMRYLLKQHKTKIDEQLQHLRKEKEHIDTIVDTNMQGRLTVDKNEKSKELIDIMLPFDPPQLVQLNKDEVSDLLSSVLMKMQTTEPTTYVTPTTVVPPITVSTTTLDPEKIRIISTIQRNENLTNAILTKIDQNTEVLRLFLLKLSDRIEPQKEEVTEATPVKADFKNFIHDPFFNRPMPHLEVQKNDTHVSIPFVYAYQQPYPLQPVAGNKAPVASVVYQGTIHTNAMLNNIKEKKMGLTKGIKRNVNQTRFFMDDMESGFKVISDDNVKKKLFPVLQTNVTVV